MTPDLDAWDAWEPPLVAARLAGVGVPWCVAGGWAIDLFLGERTRPHDDLDLAVPAASFPAVAARFPDLEFHVAGDGQVEPVTPAALARHYQTWALDPAAGVWRFDVLREPSDGGVWVARRDARLRRPYGELICFDRDGIPYLSPEVNLFFKAALGREKDRADYERVEPLLTGAQRAWLDAALS
ncbi:nucleotidyltransferase domain-containing protein [Actinoplanes sp. RD1]|uniref:nucleotidyltransferase domain-containing protein n=1 Tax=Actinoplanes sp. RD1 TaxID=3064538 RepID=UPI002741621F|nr:hypothetical protein [Actinoplanes sp. RD1]